jgi:hypothetical protein
MKLIKLSFIVAIAVMAIIGISTPSYAFHGGGVANCESCHTMHNSLNNLAMTGTKNTTPSGAANPAGSAIFLLRGTDQSSTCLNCHEATDQSSYHVSAPNATITAAANTPINFGPGGDFSWLKSATTTTVVAASTLNRRGHNIVATDFSYGADTENLTAPGGGGLYAAGNLNCISCHNPHNQLRRTSDANNGFVKPANGTNVYGIAGSGSASNAPVATPSAPLGPYRFLRGAGADQAPVSTGFVFASNPPAVSSPNTYNRSEAAAQTHVAYGSGMSAWCGNCHSGMNVSAGAVGGGAHPHPVDRAIGTMSATYNAYKGSGDLTNLVGGYSSLVPVEMATDDYATLKAAASSANGGGNYIAVTATAKVMCLSCHRAHASGFASMTRFNVAGSTTDATGAYVLASGMTNSTQALAAYYNQPASQFTANTKQLCNKCHVKD